jgi:histone H4
MTGHAGKGKGGKVAGKPSRKRHTKRSTKPISDGITPAIRRLTRRGGVKRISSFIKIYYGSR